VLFRFRGRGRWQYGRDTDRIEAHGAAGGGRETDPKDGRLHPNDETCCDLVVLGSIAGLQKIARGETDEGTHRITGRIQALHEPAVIAAVLDQEDRHHGLAKSSFAVGLTIGAGNKVQIEIVRVLRRRRGMCGGIGQERHPQLQVAYRKAMDGGDQAAITGGHHAFNGRDPPDPPAQKGPRPQDQQQHSALRP